MAACVEDTDLKAATDRAEMIIDDVVENCFGDRKDMVIYTKGDGNFRMQYSDYKYTRKKNKLPDTLAGVRSYLVQYGEQAHGAEADDYCVIDAQRCLDNGIDYVIATIDKDLLQMPGKHYNIRRQDFRVVTPDEGYFWLMEQCLMGDAADNIKGIRGVGPAKAFKALKHTTLTLPQCVYRKYLEFHYGNHEVAKAHLEKCWNGVYMRRYEHELKILPLPKEFTA